MNSRFFGSLFDGSGKLKAFNDLFYFKLLHIALFYAVPAYSEQHGVLSFRFKKLELSREKETCETSEFTEVVSGNICTRLSLALTPLTVISSSCCTGKIMQTIAAVILIALLTRISLPGVRYCLF